MFSQKVYELAAGLVIVNDFKVKQMNDQEIILQNGEVQITFEPVN